MEERTKYHLRMISIFLILVLLLGTLPASNAQVTSETQAKRVIFRDDDVTPGYWLVLKAINQVHIDEGVPVTLGVIPALSFPAQAPLIYQKGHRVEFNKSIIDARGLSSSSFNSSFAKYLRSLASIKLFELAQHGYEHRDNSELFGLSLPSEFRGVSYDEQYTLIKGGRSLMQSAFGATPTSFIPPFNTGDENTLRALNKLNFTVYSSYPEEFDTTHSENLTLKPQRLAINVNKGDRNTTLEFWVNQTEPLLNDPRVNDIVIVYHYRYFAENGTTDSVNSTKLDVLRDYIQYLKTKNVTFTTLNGTVPNVEHVGASLNATQTAVPLVMLQKTGTEWIWVVLALALAGVVGIFASRKKQVK